jgi:transcriptional regulator with XRE-family HTH domain
MLKTELDFSGSKIRELLYTQGESQQWLAAQTGYTPETVSRYLNGKLPVSMKFAAQAARVLGVPLHWLLEEQAVPSAA